MLPLVWVPHPRPCLSVTAHIASVSVVLASALVNTKASLNPFVLENCGAVVAETCFLLVRSGFDPSLSLLFIKRGVAQVPLVLQNQIIADSTMFKRYEIVPASMVYATPSSASRRSTIFSFY